MKILIIILIGLLVFGFIFLINQKEEIEMEEKIYQGPVPEYYDEEHFRKTGETKLMEIKE